MIDWEEMDEKTYAENMRAGRADGERRVALIQEAMGYSPPKPGPGRPPKVNGATAQD